jgi:hypothetical protein
MDEIALPIPNGNAILRHGNIERGSGEPSAVWGQGGSHHENKGMY